MTRQPRILFYLPDDDPRSLRCYLAIAHQLAQDLPNVQQKLLVKSPPQIGVPPGVEVAVIPESTRVTTNRDSDSPRKAQHRRAEYILNTIFQFHPHLVLVDRVASGLNGEVLPALRFLKVWSPQTKIVYGMPDVDASPQTIKVSWQINGIYKLLDEVYDRILFYGQRDLFDPIMAYQLPLSTAVKVVECGYLHDSCNGSKVTKPVKKQSGDKFSVLIIVDSVEAIENCIEFFNRYQVKNNPYAPVHLSLLIDPQLTIQQVRDFLSKMEQWSVDAVSFNLSLGHQIIDSADLVVCNASYDSVSHVIGRNKKVLYLIGEQTPPDYLMRASALFHTGLAHICDLTVDSDFLILRGMNGWLTGKTSLSSPSLHLNGVRLASQNIVSMMESAMGN